MIVNCCESSQKHSIVGHVVVEHSFDPVSSYFLFICDLTDDTYCLTCAINYKQTTLRYFAGERTLWPSGQLLSEHNFIFEYPSNASSWNEFTSLLYNQMISLPEAWRR